MKTDEKTIAWMLVLLLMLALSGLVGCSDDDPAGARGRRRRRCDDRELVTGYVIVDTDQSRLLRRPARDRRPGRGRGLLRPGRPDRRRPAELRRERRRPDRLRRDHRPDLGAVARHRRRRRARIPGGQADLDRGPGLPGHAERGRVRRLRRLAPADDQGALLPDPFSGEDVSPEAPTRRRARSSTPTPSTSSTATRAPGSGSSTPSTPRAPCTWPTRPRASSCSA